MVMTTTTTTMIGKLKTKSLLLLLTRTSSSFRAPSILLRVSRTRLDHTSCFPLFLSLSLSSQAGYVQLVARDAHACAVVVKISRGWRLIPPFFLTFFIQKIIETEKRWKRRIFLSSSLQNNRLLDYFDRLVPCSHIARDAFNISSHICLAHTHLHIPGGEHA